VRIPIKRINKLFEILEIEAFITKCRSKNPKNFTRKRKMPLKKLILSIIARKGTNLSTKTKETNPTVPK